MQSPQHPIQSAYHFWGISEDASGRFHASLAFTRQALDQVGGWPLTLRGDFDQQFIRRLNSLGVPADPVTIAAPSNIFRWGSTGAYHGQSKMRGPDDETWYLNVPTVSEFQHGDPLIPGTVDEPATVIRP